MPRIIRVGESLFESGSGYLIAVQGNEWKSRNWPLFFHSCKHLQHCRQSRIEGIEISLREKTKIDSIGTTPCTDYSKTCPIFIPRKRNTSNYRHPPPPLFFSFTLVSKTVDKLNSTSPVRKQLATIELKVSNLCLVNTKASKACLLKQRVLSISLTFFLPSIH